MRKNNILLLAGLCLFIASCETSEEPNLPASPMANVHLVFKYNMDLTNDTNEFGRYEAQMNPIPVGTKIQFSVPGTDLQSQVVNGYNYQDYVTTAVVNSQGELMVDLPVGSKGSNVRVTGDEFEADYYYIEYDRLNKPQKVSKSVIYKLNVSSLNLYPNARSFHELTYTKK